MPKLYKPCLKDAAYEAPLHLDYCLMRRKTLNVFPYISKVKWNGLGHILFLCANVTNHVPRMLYVNIRVFRCQPLNFHKLEFPKMLPTKFGLNQFSGLKENSRMDNRRDMITTAHLSLISSGELKIWWYDLCYFLISLHYNTQIMAYWRSQKLCINLLPGNIKIRLTLVAFPFRFSVLWLFLLANGRLGLLGLWSLLVGAPNGGEVGRNLGDLDALGDDTVRCEVCCDTASPWISWRRFSFSDCWVSTSLSQCRNSSSTFVFKTGFNAIFMVVILLS